ncbi:MAG TPA: hypothetical protein VFA18_18500, partial [Gemmataceae bacterium]|nr:hypothetical protein [Gemmataceae bacterium]
VIEYPAMVFQANQSMKLWLGGAGRDWSSSVVAPQDGKLARALLFGLKQAPRNKVAVDITLQDEKPAGNTGKYTALPGTLRHVAAEVTPGKIAKLPVPRLGNDEPRQWLEVMVRNFKFPPGSLMPPPRAEVFTLHLDLTEIRSGGEKELASPTLQVIEGRTAQFSSLAQGTGHHQGVPVSGLAWSANIKKLHDGRLQLDMHLDRHAKRHEDSEALEVHTSTLHVIKVIQPDQKLDFQLDGTGKADHPIRVQLDVSQVKS